MKILGVDKRNCIVYITIFIISAFLIGLSFINPSLYGWSLCSSLGIGGFGSVLVAYFIDLSANKREKDILNRYIKNLKLSLARGYCDILNILQEESKKRLYKDKINMAEALGKKFELILKNMQDKYPIYQNNKPTVLSFEENRLTKGLKFSCRMGKLQIDILDIFNHRFEFVNYGFFEEGEIDSLRIMQIQLNNIQESERAYEVISYILEFYAWNFIKLDLSDYFLEYNKERRKYEVKDKQNKVVTF